MTADVRAADVSDADFSDADFPAEPYPGARPDRSFAHEDGSGWFVAGRDLDGWLARRGAEPREVRVPLLAYGSNACPSKITWLREVHGLRGPVVVLRVEVRGIAAVWAAGLRIVDDQRPATLAALPGAHETHAVWLASVGQIEALDRCEGRGQRYDLARLTCGDVTTEDGTTILDVFAYVGRSPARMPLLVDGSPVRCRDVGQAQARVLRGVSAIADGLWREVLAP